MSYDLYLWSPRLDGDAFALYFERRPHYQETGWYANKDTGVYFNFSFCQPEVDEVADPESPEILRRPHVVFNINYFRPHVFGLEAAPEVAAFVAEFGCAIHDPQIHGMGDGDYSTDGFLRGWNKGNSFGYRSIGAEGGMAEALIADDALIERVWRWNLERAASQAQVGGERFLPLVNWAKVKSDGSPITFAVWGEGVVTAIPECASHVLLARQPRWRLKSVFGQQKSEVETMLTSTDYVAALDGCTWREIPAGRILLSPTQMPPPRSVRAAFDGSFPGMEAKAVPVASDHVLNSSLIAPMAG